MAKAKADSVGFAFTGITLIAIVVAGGVFLILLTVGIIYFRKRQSEAGGDAKQADDQGVTKVAKESNSVSLSEVELIFSEFELSVPKPSSKKPKPGELRAAAAPKQALDFNQFTNKQGIEI